jgi:hypothetical protein
MIANQQLCDCGRGNQAEPKERASAGLIPAQVSGNNALLWSINATEAIPSTWRRPLMDSDEIAP